MSELGSRLRCGHQTPFGTLGLSDSRLALPPLFQNNSARFNLFPSRPPGYPSRFSCPRNRFFSSVANLVDVRPPTSLCCRTGDTSNFDDEGHETDLLLVF